MFQSALNPLVWWGLALISVPIIIHLINRLRYRRIRWAAMEFLLKSQQRNRRKLIIEQLLLLLLRCLIVACVVALIARPTWFLGDEGRATDWPSHHLILLDDTLSMQDLKDAQAPEGETAFRTATKLLGNLAQNQLETGGVHFWTVLRFTQPQLPEVGKALPADVASAPEGPLGQQLQVNDLPALRDRFDGLRCSFLPATPLAALKEASRYLDRIKEGHRVLHLVSDFRRVDWLDAQAGELNQLLAEQARLKVKVRLHDVAWPARGPGSGETPPAHGNVGLTSVQVRARRKADSASAPASSSDEQPLRVVTPRLPFDVHAVVKNFSEAERRSVRVVVSIGGVEKGSRILDRLPGNGETLVVFNLEFTPEDAVGLKAVTVRIDDANQRDFLPIDNARHAFVELRRDLPVLFVDGDIRSEAPSDSFFLNAALTSTPRTGLRVERISPRDVAKRQDLATFGVIYLLNLAGVGKGDADLEPEGLAALEAYVKAGGCLVLTLGPKTNVVAFNEQYYRQGKGVLPAPLLTRPDPEGRSTLPFIDEAPDERDLSPKVRFTAAGHPAMPFEGDLVDLLSRYMTVNRYFRVDPGWQPPKDTRVLLRLANRRPLSYYVDDAKAMADAIARLGGPQSAKLRSGVDAIHAALEDAAEKKNQKGPLTDALTSLRNDQALAEIWNRQGGLRGQVDKLIERLQEGDPLLLESSLGAGHVVTLLTPAAPTSIRGREYSWNNLASGDLGEFFFVPFALSLQSYLGSLSAIGGDRAANRYVGETYELLLDKDRYQPEVEVTYQADDAAAPARVNIVTAELAPLPGVTGPKNQAWKARFSAVRGPGLYRLRLNQPKSDGAAPVQGEITLDPQAATAKAPPEERPLAFNVDNRAEGALERFAEVDLREKLAQGLNEGPAKMSLSEAQAFVQNRSWFVLDPLGGEAQEMVKSSSWSDYSWILFAFLGFLLTEQWLAMRFSHLTK